MDIPSAHDYFLCFSIYLISFFFLSYLIINTKALVQMNHLMTLKLKAFSMRLYIQRIQYLILISQLGGFRGSRSRHN